MQNHAMVVDEGLKIKNMSKSAKGTLEQRSKNLPREYPAESTVIHVGEDVKVYWH